MDRKDELRDQALDYCLAHGIAELSLRPMASQIGTSARLLIYHFGSRDGLLVAIMDEAQRRVRNSFSALLLGAGDKTVLRTFWDWTTDSRNTRYLSLLFEVQMLALQNPATYSHYLQSTSSSWLALIESVLPPSADRRARATLCAAVIDGLLLEFLSTGDLARTSSALDIFDSMLRGGAPRKSRARPVSRRRRPSGS